MMNRKAYFLDFTLKCEKATNLHLYTKLDSALLALQTGHLLYYNHYSCDERK